MIKPCIEYLGFDDRRLMLIGIPLQTFVIPIMLNTNQQHKNAGLGYWEHQVPESLFFVAGFWLFYRWLIIASRKYITNIESAKYRIYLLILAVLISAPILKGVFSFFTDVILSLFGQHDHVMPGSLTLLMNIYIPSIMIISVYEAAYYFVRYKQALIDREQLEARHLQAELTNLRNQINPHFLFNSLNTLMNLIPSDPNRAVSYLSKLSKFYRYAVGEKEEKLIPLSKEIEFAHLYADLLSERFGDSLQVLIKVTDTANMIIPPLTIQLLIENAVKHNIVSEEMPLKVVVENIEKGRRIEVRNNLQHKITAVSSSGIGIANIKKRFEYFHNVDDVMVEETEAFFKVCVPVIYDENHVLIKS